MKNKNILIITLIVLINLMACSRTPINTEDTKTKSYDNFNASQEITLKDFLKLESDEKKERLINEVTSECSPPPILGAPIMDNGDDPFLNYRDQSVTCIKVCRIENSGSISPPVTITLGVEKLDSYVHDHDDDMNHDLLGGCKNPRPF